jgi:hypothetical protein
VSDERASNADRSRATAVVEAALKSGRIIPADHDLRIGQIRSGRTKQDVDLVVRDLPGGLVAAAAPSYGGHTGPTTSTPVTSMPAPSVASAPSPDLPPPGGAATPQQPWPLVNYGGVGESVDLGQAQVVAKKAGFAVAMAVVMVVLISIAGVAIALFTAADTFTEGPFAEPIDETTYLPGVQPGPDGVNVFTAEGYGEMVSELEDVAGSADVFNAVLYPRYAILSVPVKDTGKRLETYRWDGRSLIPTGIKSTSDGGRVDLDAIDVKVLIGLMEQNRGRMSDENVWYAVISANSTGPSIGVYASNAFGEGAYLLATLDGEITYEGEY